MLGVAAQRIARLIRKPRNNADECPARKPEGTGLSCQPRGRSAVAPLARGACHGRRVASRISSRKAAVAATRGLFRGSLAMAAARVILAGALAHNMTRSVLSVLAIALGVALGYAVQLITESAQNELALGVQTLSGEADLQLRGPRGGFDENLYADVARLPEVAVSSPIVEIDAKLADR